MTLDLRALAADRYRLGDEPGWQDQHGNKVKGAPPAILAPQGHYYAHGPDTLGVCTKTRGSAAKRLAKLGRLYLDSDEGVTVLLRPDQFAAACEIMPPYRRRKLTPEQRAKLVASGRQFQIPPGAQRPLSKRQRAQAA
jgi:hypothetical protein